MNQHKITLNLILISFLYTASVQGQFDLQTPFSLIKTEVHKLELIKKPSLLINGAEMSINYQYDPIQGHLIFNRTNINASLQHIPFVAQQDGQWMSGYGFGNVFSNSLRFDPKSYVESLRKSLGDKFNPESFLDHTIDPTEVLKDQAERLLKSELRELNEKYRGLLNDKIAGLGSIEELMEKDFRSVTATLLNADWVEEIARKKILFSEWQTALAQGGKPDSAALRAISDEITIFNGVKQLLSTVESHKSRWLSSGLLQKIRQSRLMKEVKLRQIMNNPNSVIASAKQYLSLNGIQRLFLKITKLDLGRTVPSLSQLSAGNVIVNGLNTGFRNNNKTIGLLAGVKPIFNSVTDHPFMNANIFGSDEMLLGLFLGREGVKGNAGNISFLSYRSTRNSNFPLGMVSLAPRSGIVLGFNRKLDMGKGSILDLEISKSSSRYLNDLSDSSNKSSGVSKLLKGDNFFSNLAISADYRGHFTRINLDATIRLKYAGMEYDNPAATFLQGGSRELMTSFRKTFLNKKLVVLLRNTMRQHRFSSAKSDHWITQSSLVDLRWKLKKAQYISFRYQPSRSLQSVDKRRLLVYRNDQASLGAVFGKKWKRINYRNNISITYANTSSPLMGDSSALLSNSFQFSTSQMVSSGNQSFFWNTSYTRMENPSSFLYFNTSFQSDMGISFLVGEISFSSALSYQSVKGWYQQAGIRQMVSGNLGKRFSMNVFVDAGKVIKVMQPLPYSLIRANCSMFYYFGKQKK